MDKRCNRCHRPMMGTTAYDGACECGGLIESAPKLGQNEAEAQRLAIGGRQIRSLKENRTYDTERLAELPLFREKGRLF